MLEIVGNEESRVLDVALFCIVFTELDSMASFAGRRAAMRHYWRRWLDFAPSVAARVAERLRRAKAAEAAHRAHALDELTSQLVRTAILWPSANRG